MRRGVLQSEIKGTSQHRHHFLNCSTTESQTVNHLDLKFNIPLYRKAVQQGLSQFTHYSQF